MKYSVTGADKETGNDVAISLAADSQLEAMQMASQRGIMIATIEPIAELEPAASKSGPVPHQDHPAPAHANQPHAAAQQPAVPNPDVPQQNTHKVENHNSATAFHNVPNAATTSHAPAIPHASNAPPPHPTVPPTAASTPPPPAISPVAAPSDQHAPAGASTTQAAASISSAPAHEAHHFQPGQVEYKLMVNQALYLLESAVNKYLKEGWEPTGGLTVGVSNNALQFYQALIRRH